MLATEIQLLPDKTFFIQLATFLVVAVSLNHFVFKPVFRIISLRKSKTEGDRQKILNLTEKTESLIKEYEEKMRTAKQEAFKVKEEIRKEGEEQSHRIVQEAKQASLAQIDKIKKEVASASQVAGRDLEDQAKTLGKSLAEKVLGRSLDAK